MQLQFWLQTRFWCEAGFQDRFLDDFLVKYVIFERKSLFCLLFFGVPYEPRPCKLQDNNLTRTRQEPPLSSTPAAERPEPKGGGGVPPRGASIKFAVPHRGTGRFINPTRTEAFFPAFAGWSVAPGPCAFRRPPWQGCPGPPLAPLWPLRADFFVFFPEKKATKNRLIFWNPPGRRFFPFRLPKRYQNH